MQATRLEQERPEAVEAAKRAAMEAAAVGDGIGTRFRDEDFFVGGNPSGRRQFEEEELSVRGGTASQMEGAVMDLVADDQVRSIPQLARCLL